MIVGESFTDVELKCLEKVASFLLHHTEGDGSGTFSIQAVKRLKSAQQHVLVLSVELQQHSTKNLHQPDQNDNPQSNQEIRKLKDIILKGDGKIVLRIWSNGARWWNLNMKQLFLCVDSDVSDDESTHNEEQLLILRNRLALSEVSGYRVAKRAIQYYNMKRRKNNEKIPEQEHQSLETRICIPEVIHFNLEENPSLTSQPWALFSYVGEGSSHINNDEEIRLDKSSRWFVCDDFIYNMVKIRHEFGFDEPHPRHGRVNVDQALDYALQVLDTIILPIHFAFFDEFYAKYNNGKKHPRNHFESDLLKEDSCNLVWDWFSKNHNSNSISDDLMNSNEQRQSSCTYKDMVKFYETVITNLQNQLNPKECSEINEAEHIQAKDQNNDNNDKKFAILIDVLTECVQTLQTESNDFADIQELPAVLCHIDLQPQNMILCKKVAFNNDGDEIPKIFSVLDWEESCYADPRFELLLLCRKVVANRDQANVLWDRYESFVNGNFGAQVCEHRRYPSGECKIGSIEPWLKLETVHSILTMTIQGMDLGGRSPWEEKPELFDKISRELMRLESLGWKFCDQFLRS